MRSLAGILLNFLAMSARLRLTLRFAGAQVTHKLLYGAQSASGRAWPGNRFLSNITFLSGLTLFGKAPRILPLNDFATDNPHSPVIFQTEFDRQHSDCSLERWLKIIIANATWCLTLALCKVLLGDQHHVPEDDSMKGLVRFFFFPSKWILSCRLVKSRFSLKVRLV